MVECGGDQTERDRPPKEVEGGGPAEMEQEEEPKPA